MDNLEHLEIRKETCFKSITRKQKRVKELDKLIFEFQQRRHRLLESISGLKKEHSLLDREIFNIKHPKGAREKLRDLEKEVGKAQFAKAIALLKKEASNA